VAEQIKVELYTQSTCPWSRNARAWLDNHHVAYDFVDYDLADEGMQAHIQEEMVSRGASAFPFVMFGDAEFIIGYNPDAFARLLGLPKDEASAAEGDETGECVAGFEGPAPES
jgi:mycoredoxin